MMQNVRQFAANLTGGGQQKASPPNDPNQQSRQQQEVQKQPDPMDIYKDIFKAQDPSKADVPPGFDLPGDAINKAAEGLSFTNSIPEELRASLEGMGEQGKAIMAMFDHVGRQAYATSMAHMSNLTGKFVDNRSQYDRKGLGRSINEHLALNSVSSLAGENSNPVVKEGMRMIGKQISAQYPDATPEWVAQKSREFFMEMAKSTSPDQFKKDNAATEAQAPGGLDFNWSEWADGQKGQQQQAS
jgi:hypothetical protein